LGSAVEDRNDTVLVEDRRGRRDIHGFSEWKHVLY
jgi:hypothetical protein